VFFTNWLGFACWAASSELRTKVLRQRYITAVLNQDVTYVSNYEGGMHFSADTVLLHDGSSL